MFTSTSHHAEPVPSLCQLTLKVQYQIPVNFVCASVFSSTLVKCSHQEGNMQNVHHCASSRSRSSLKVNCQLLCDLSINPLPLLGFSSNFVQNPCHCLACSDYDGVFGFGPQNHNRSRGTHKQLKPGNLVIMYSITYIHNSLYYRHGVMIDH
jgi:hypothetical protein